MTTLHLVSHTHWDREWYLTFQQFRLKLVHLVDHLLMLLEKDPEFKFFMLDGQTIVLDDYLAMRPEKESLLQRYIQEGRILIGPWHILPDEFLVSPEATIRNLLQGNRTALRFGPKMMVGYIPDPFGHIGQMPQILRGFGIQTACVMRGLSDEPAEFWWRAPDGSCVFMAYLRDGYGNAAGLPGDDPQRFVSEVRRLRDSLLPYSACGKQDGQILLMLGTDHMEPLANTSELISYANQDGRLDGDRLIHSTLPDYIKASQAAIVKNQADIPIIDGELRSSKRTPLLPGVLSARIWIKQRNHDCQTLLEKWAEPFSTWAEIVEATSVMDSSSALISTRIHDPAPILRQTWRLLMENHPHDSICGCSIDQVHEEMRPRFDQVEQIGEEITRQSLELITNTIDTLPNKGQNAYAALVIYNPTSGPRADGVTFTLELPHNSEDFEVVDENGKVVPHAVEGLGSRDLINMSMDRKAFKEALGMIGEGRVMGMVVRAMNLHRDGEKMLVETILAETGEPDLSVWGNAMRQVDALLADPSLTTFDVHARTAPTTSAIITASDVPGFGYRTFWLRASKTQTGISKPVQTKRLANFAIPLAVKFAKFVGYQQNQPATRSKPKPAAAPPFIIQNDCLVVEASQKDGSLSIRDKHSGITYAGLNRFIDSGDCGDEYNYSPPPNDRLIKDIQIYHVSVEQGTIQQTIEIEMGMRLPAGLSTDRRSRSSYQVELPITTRITLTRNVRRVNIHTEIDNRSNDEEEKALASDHRMRVHFPAFFGVSQANYDGHFETITRSTRLPAYDDTWIEHPRPEKPQRAFTEICDGKNGLLIANRGLPEVAVLTTPEGNTEIALTLLRCISWLSRDDFSTRKGHAGPKLETSGAQMPGKYAFDYAIIPYRVDVKEAASPYELAYAFQAPLRSSFTPLHPGSLPYKGAFIQPSPEDFVISAIKMADDGSGWIVRGYNRTRETIQVTLKPWRTFARAEKVSLAEQVEMPLSTNANGSVSFTAQGNQIVTVKFSQEPQATVNREQETAG